MPKVLEVYITEIGGSMQTLRFSSSPVRIGRNQLNDIPLEDPFVSEWHGAIRFDEDSIAYSDMGSTNGSILDGKKLAKNVSAPLSDLSRLVLGRRELMVARVSGEATAPRPPSSKSPVPSAPTMIADAASLEPPKAFTDPGPRKPSDSGVNKTMGWGEPIQALPTPDRRPGVIAAEVDAQSGHRPTRIGLAEEAKVIVQLSQPGSLDARAVAPPEPARRPPVEAERRGPAQAPVVGAPAGQPAPAVVSSVDDAMRERQHKLLEAFAEAFVGLRKGYEQFGSEVGVRTVNGTTPLHRARTSREVLAHILNPKVDAGAVSRDMIGIFADFGIHHIAMMEGITQGVRGVLQSLDPRANDLEPTGGLFSGGKNKARWNEYLERFDQLITDDEQLHIAIFGEEFAHAYASVTQGDAKPPRSGKA